jgi:hypothetical protein
LRACRSPETTTTYTVTITFADGRTEKNTVKVLVSAAPAARIIASGTTVLCAGQQVVLTADASAAYLWSSGETTQSITVAKAGIYSVAVTNAAGCSAASEEIFVEVAGSATAQAGPDVALCAGSAVSLSASGGDSYTWFPATGLSDARLANPVASPDQTRAYTVTITRAGGCTFTDQVRVTVNARPFLSLDYLPAVACFRNTLIGLSAGVPVRR